MEPEIRAYFVRILNTLSIGLIWMASNATLGIMLKLAYPINNHYDAWNYGFYSWMAISFIAFVYIAYRIWRKPIFTDKNRPQ